jgi:hypothetical protein
MKDVYYEKFLEVLEDTWKRNDYYLPLEMRSYTASLLAAHVDKTNFFSEPFGLRYMDIQTSTNAKELGDNCLVIAGIFPGYRSMPDRYYIEIGVGSYSVAADATGSVMFGMMSDNFETVVDGLRQLSPPTLL